MKIFYEAPVMDVVEFEVEDIITTSICGEAGDLSDLLKPSDNFNGGALH